MDSDTDMEMEDVSIPEENQEPQRDFEVILSQKVMMTLILCKFVLCIYVISKL